MNIIENRESINTVEASPTNTMLPQPKTTS